MTTIKNAIAQNMAKLGSPVLSTPTSYEWMDIEASNHIMGIDTSTYPPRESESCSWQSPDQPVIEEVFITMSGNPYSEIDTEKMIQMNHFSCTCGKYRDVTIRYDGGMIEFLTTSMEDED